MLRGLRHIGFTMLAASLAFWADASIVHTPKFKVDGIVIVWSGASEDIATSSPKARAAQNVRLKTTLRAAPPPAITGVLLPITDASADTLVPLQAPARGKTSFYVASNTAFQIDAELSDPLALSPEALANLPFEMHLTLQGEDLPSIGRKAQYPHSAGPHGGFVPHVNSLWDLYQRTTVFTGNQRTAAKPGTIAEQSVQFITEYGRLETSVSENAPSVIFTVFVP